MNGTLLTNLTERQKLILKLIADNFTDEEIAQKLRMSPRTFEYHKKLLRQTIREAGASDLGRIATQNGVPEP